MDTNRFYRTKTKTFNSLEKRSVTQRPILAWFNKIQTFFLENANRIYQLTWQQIEDMIQSNL